MRGPKGSSMRCGHACDEIDSVQNGAAESFDVRLSLQGRAAAFLAKALLASIPTPTGTKISRCSELKSSRELQRALCPRQIDPTGFKRLAEDFAAIP